MVLPKNCMPLKCNLTMSMLQGDFGALSDTGTRMANNANKCASLLKNPQPSATN
jgi:hypothetical protein